jgi:hypothetical protein
MAGPPRRLTSPAAKGSYALLLRLEEAAVIPVGKLGEFAQLKLFQENHVHNST